MNVTPFPVVHIQVPVWACIVALLILAAALAWDVYGAQIVRDQVEQAADDADKALTAVEKLREELWAPADDGWQLDPDPATEPFAMPDTGPPTVPGTEAVAQPFETWLADATADLDQQFADAKAELYGTPTVRSET